MGGLKMQDLKMKDHRNSSRKMEDRCLVGKLSDFCRVCTRVSRAVTGYIFVKMYCFVYFV